jgi:hypothetical protein
MPKVLLDAAGRRRSPATVPRFHAGRPPRNKAAATRPTRRRSKRSSRSCAPSASDARTAAARPRRPALARRRAHPRSPPAQRGRPRPAPRLVAGAPRQGRAPPPRRHGRLGLGASPAVARGPHRTAGRTAVPLLIIQRQLGHTNLGITSIYLQGIDSAEIIDTVHARPTPMVPVDSSLSPDGDRRSSRKQRRLLNASHCSSRAKQQRRGSALPCDNDVTLRR